MSDLIPESALKRTSADHIEFVGSRPGSFPASSFHHDVISIVPPPSRRIHFTPRRILP